MKYLGIRIDNKLNWKAHINNIALKLIRGNAMLYKCRDFVDAGILKSIYHALFELHIHYVCITWGQNVCTINQLFILQKKALRLIHFKELNAHSAPLFFKSKIVKLPDKKKIVFSSASMSIKNYLPSLIAGLYFPPLAITMKLHLQPTFIYRFLLLLQLHMVKEPLLVWPQKHGIILKAKLKIPW